MLPRQGRCRLVILETRYSFSFLFPPRLCGTFRFLCNYTSFDFYSDIYLLCLSGSNFLDIRAFESIQTTNSIDYCLYLFGHKFDLLWRTSIQSSIPVTFLSAILGESSFLIAANYSIRLVRTKIVAQVTGNFSLLVVFERSLCHCSRPLI